MCSVANNLVKCKSVFNTDVITAQVNWRYLTWLFTQSNLLQDGRQTECYSEKENDECDL